jgi:hypothetical protein
MSSLAIGAEPATASTEFDATTVSSDELRATVRLRGLLSADSVPLLIGVLNAHQRGGRRYLRVNLAECEVAGRGVLEPLRSAHAAIAESGGMLVFDQADPAAAALLHRGDLFVSTSL